MIPFPTPSAIAYLAGHPDVSAFAGNRVSTELGDVLPALRLTLIPAGSPKDWQWTATYEVEAWAEDELDAGNLITAVRAAWPSFRGPIPGGYVSGAWVVWEPRALHDKDTDLARYTITVACHVHPPKETP